MPSLDLGREWLGSRLFEQITRFIALDCCFAPSCLDELAVGYFAPILGTMLPLFCLLSTELAGFSTVFAFFVPFAGLSPILLPTSLLHTAHSMPNSSLSRAFPAINLILWPNCQSTSCPDLPPRYLCGELIDSRENSSPTHFPFPTNPCLSQIPPVSVSLSRSSQLQGPAQ